MGLIGKLTVCVLLFGVLYYCVSALSADSDEVVQKHANSDDDCGCSKTSRPASQVADADTPTEAVPASGAALPKGPKASPTNRMVHIEGGTFVMGTDNPIIPADGEGPARRVTVDSFWMDIHEVSNSDFEAFVTDTGYVTEVSNCRSINCDSGFCMSIKVIPCGWFSNERNIVDC
jgi:formylglycine-generating enzyme